MPASLAEQPVPAGDAGTKTWPSLTFEDGFTLQLMPQGVISYSTITLLLPANFKNIDIMVKVPFFLPTLPTPSSSDRVDLELFYRIMANPGDLRPTVWASKTVSIDDSNAPAATNAYGLVLFRIPVTFSATFQGMGQMPIVLARRSDDTILDNFELINTVSFMPITPSGPGPDVTDAILVL